MSTLENTATADLTRIPLNRRLGEILSEKGEEYSIRKFAERIGFNRETLRKMIVEGRRIAPSELEKICQHLGISVERLKQIDTVNLQQELDRILHAGQHTKMMLTRALTIATELAHVAIGTTERALSIANLGRVYFYSRRYDEAHDAWLQALELAEQVHQEYEDGALLYKITSFLMISYTVRQEYSNILQTLKIVETAFSEQPEKMGYVHYTRMKWYEHRDEMELAKHHSRLALEQFEKTKNPYQIGHALVNVAHYEYITREYEQAAKNQEQAVEVLEYFDHSRLVAVKEFGKTLLRLNRQSEVIQLVEQYTQLAKEYPEVYGKLQILYSIAHDTNSYAEAVSSDLHMNPSVRILACKYLMEYYNEKDDSESVMKFYKLGRLISKNKAEFSLEEI